MACYRYWWGILLENSDEKHEKSEAEMGTVHRSNTEQKVIV
jgi:hypothetical protein